MPIDRTDIAPSPAAPDFHSGSMLSSQYGSTGSAVQFFNSPIGATVYWPSAGLGLRPRSWQSQFPKGTPAAARSKPCVPGTMAVRLRPLGPMPLALDPPPLHNSPPGSPPRLGGSGGHSSPRGMRHSLRSITTVGERNARRPDLSPRSLAGTRGGGASVAVLALAQQQQQQDDEADIPTEVQDEGDETPPRRRLLHAHPALDGSGTDHWPHGAPQTTKAKSRRLAAQLHRMLRGSDLTP